MAFTVDDVKAAIIEFCAQYPAVCALNFRVRDTQEELYGQAATREAIGRIGGAFRSSRGEAAFAASNIRSEDELEEIIKHELLGHFGINTFRADEKQAVLTAIVHAHIQPGLAGIWEQIDQLYPELDDIQKAEEVYAFACEAIQPTQQIAIAEGERSLRETCLEQTRPLELQDLYNITSLVAAGLRDRTRSQQTFPADDQQFKKDTNMESKKPFHETVAENLIKQLEQGTAPWQKPWAPGEPSAMLPTNPTTDKRYKGINAIHLMSQGYEDQRWLTYKQASAIGAQVRKGEKSTTIQYWKFNEERTKTDDNGKPVIDAQGEAVKTTVALERPKVFYASVFNAQQIDGLPPLQPRPQPEWSPIERAEQMLKASGADIREEPGNRAFYSPVRDAIVLPERAQFDDAAKFYAVGLHELGHWTGHPTRLDRDLAHPFGSEGYAKEELRAEIASMIVGDELGIGHDPSQHVAYVKSWIKALKDDPMEIFRAAADAEKIHGHLLSLEQTYIQTQDQQQHLENELQQIHAQAVSGYSPLETWQNLSATAAVNGLVATLGRGVGAELDAPYAISYSDQTGREIGVTTVMWPDGKALTEVNGRRVPGTGPTSDPEWQTAALSTAVVTATAALTASADAVDNVKFYRLSDPRNDADYQKASAAYIIDKAEGLGATRFQAVMESGAVRQINKTENGQWLRDDGVFLPPLSQTPQAGIESLHQQAANIYNPIDDWNNAQRTSQNNGQMVQNSAGLDYNQQLDQRLMQSTLTPGSYEPTDAAKTTTHAAVFAGDKAMILCGPADDPASVAIAAALADTPDLKRLMDIAGHPGPIRSGFIAGADIDWQASESALASKPAGKIEMGDETGPLMAIVLNDPNRAIATVLCTTASMARQIDPDADLDQQAEFAPEFSLDQGASIEQIGLDAVRQILDGDPAALPAGGRLVDRLIDNNVMPIEQAYFADAYRDLHLVSASPLSDEVVFQRASQEAFGFAVPADWNGLVHVQQSVVERVHGVDKGLVAEGGEAAPIPRDWQGEATRQFDEEMEKSMGAPYSKAQELFSNIEGARNRIEDIHWNGRTPTEPEITEEKQLQSGIVEAEDWLHKNVYLNAVIKEKMYPIVQDRTMNFSDDIVLFLDEMKAQVQPSGSIDVASNGDNSPTWRVYAQTSSGQLEALKDFTNEGAATELADRLRLIDAYAATNERDQAAKLARIREEQIRRDPNTTDEDISAAKELRKEAEMAVMLSEQDSKNNAAVLVVDGKPVDHIVSFLDEDITWTLALSHEGEPVAELRDLSIDEMKEAIGPLNAERISMADQRVGELRGDQIEPFHGRSNAPALNLATEKTWLALPFDEKEQAKHAAGKLANGGKAIDWDRAAKCWYAYPGADLDKLKQWLPDAAQQRQPAASSPETEFAQALRDMGCVVSGNHPVMDGKKHRIEVEGGKQGAKDGVYFGHLDGHPAGYIANHKLGTETKWKAKGYVLSPEEKANLAATAAAKLDKRDEEMNRAYEQTAQRVQKMLPTLTPVTEPTPYMLAKGISPQPGVYTDAARQTFIPAIDSDGKQWSMQFINEDGTKRFAKNSRKEGCFHVVGGDLDSLAKAPALVVGEGYATMSSLTPVLGFPTVAAFDSGNLEAVVTALHEKFPDKPVIVAGDDDRHLLLTQGRNPGREKAEAAAAAVGGTAFFPVFAPGEAAYPADLPPITPDAYKAHLSATKALENSTPTDEQTQALLLPKQLDALNQMKQFTDFNDLENKSALGSDGLRRQIQSTLFESLDQGLSNGQREELVQTQKHTQTQKHDQQPRRAARIG